MGVDMPEEDDVLRVAWVPRPGTSLADFGCLWTGWSAEEGTVQRRLPTARIGVDPEEVASEPARLGLFGAVSAPFRLDPHCSVWRLDQTLESLGETLATVRLPGMRMALVDDRLALVPAMPSTGLERLMGGVRAAVESCGRRVGPGGRPPFRLPGPGDRQRGRVAAPDLPRLEGEGRFHVPLTDPVVPARAGGIAGPLAAHFEDTLLGPQMIRSLVLLADPGARRRARVLRRFDLNEDPRDRGASPFSALGPRLDAPLLGRRGEGRGAPV